MGVIAVTEYTDCGCPWAYSASPAMAVLRWRYADQLRLADRHDRPRRGPQLYIDRGLYDHACRTRLAAFRRFGMPFLTEPRARVLATSPACRTIIATRLLDPPRERDVLRALQLAWFNTPLLLDEPQDLVTSLEGIEGLDADAIIDAIDAPETVAQYEADKTETRKAEGGPTHFQGKARQTDGPVRYSAPSLSSRHEDGRRLEAGGFQTIEAYDVLVANLDPTLERRPPAEDALDALGRSPTGS